MLRSKQPPPATEGAILTVRLAKKCTQSVYAINIHMMCVKPPSQAVKLMVVSWPCASSTWFGHDVPEPLWDRLHCFPGPGSDSSRHGWHRSYSVFKSPRLSPLLSHTLWDFFFLFQDGGRKSWAGHAWAAVRAPGLPRHRCSLDAAAGFLPEDEAHQQPPGPFWPREWLRNPLMCSRGCARMSGLRCMLRCITALCMHGWEWTCSHSHAWFQAAGMFASGVNYHLPEKTPGCSG